MIQIYRFRWIRMILFLFLLCSLTACDRQETGEEQRCSANAENAENMSGAPAEDISVSRREEYSAESEDTSNPDQMVSDSSDSALNKAFQAVLHGNSPFVYCSDENAETMVITDVPALFDADDPLMKIFEFSMVDLNGDGEDEVILFVAGAAGDMGGKVILHQIGDEVYGYITDNRTLVDLKMDGTYGYSDPTGLAEAGIAAVVDFSEDGYTTDKITYATGTYEGWNAFVADHQPVTEEEYLDAVSRQNEKQNAEWYEFSNENINNMF